ncbi:hypothetical protein [Kineococcus sp. R86509]|uniref:hypothetical protein n=1 Tax=Kineococcus sp. R86509 TaxID=3093851 RepID=UPI0036D3AC15
MSVAYWFGYLQGRKEALGEQPGQFQVAAADVVRRMANTPPRDELEELRGNPAGAQRIREQWQRLGLREETP